MKSAIKYRNSISFSSPRDIQDVKLEFQELIKAKLEKLKPASLQQTEDGLIYTGGIFRFVWNWNLLYPISKGHILVETCENKLIVKYEIQFLELFAISIITAVAACFVVDNIFAKIVVAIVSVIWLFGVNAGITIFRYNRFIKGTISKILENDPPQISKEQEQWISNIAKCDACGYNIKRTDKICPDCGISLKQ
jgi:hypothetical protein